jgi:hypothetical protein
MVAVEALSRGFRVIATVSPTTHFFEPGQTFAVAAKSFQISWSAHGTDVIDLHAKGGTRYHAYVASSPVAITALPPLPLVPADLACTPLLEAQLANSFAPPATGNLGGVAAPTGYHVQIPTSINFANIAAEPCCCSFHCHCGWCCCSCACHYGSCGQG